MKSKSLILLIGLLVGITTIHGQPAEPKKKIDPRIVKAGKNLGAVLDRLYSSSNKKLKLKEPCGKTALTFIKKIPKKNLRPSDKELSDKLKEAMDSLKPEITWLYGTAVTYYDLLPKSSNFKEFIESHTRGKLEKVRPDEVKRYKDNYRRIKKFLDNGVVLFKKDYKGTPCTYTVETLLFPLSWKQGFKKDKYAMTVEWVITTRIIIGCDCVKGSATELKKAVFQYKGTSVGAIRGGYVANPGAGYKSYDGFDSFGKIKEPKLTAFEIKCCTPNDVNLPEDGSFAAPEDENISTTPTVIDVGLGAKFEKDLETMTTATAGILFNVAPEGNPFLIGGRLSVCTTALSGSDVTETIIRVGPSAEYQFPVGNQGVDIFGGVNAGFKFGDVDAFGFKQNISGFGGNLYTGVEVPVGNNLNVGAVVSLFDYSNLTFKPKGEEGIKTSSSNSIFVTDRPNISLRLRIDLDKK